MFEDRLDEFSVFTGSSAITFSVLAFVYDLSQRAVLAPLFKREEVLVGARCVVYPRTVAKNGKVGAKSSLRKAVTSALGPLWHHFRRSRILAAPVRRDQTWLACSEVRLATTRRIYEGDLQLREREPLLQWVPRLVWPEPSP